MFGLGELVKELKSTVQFQGRIEERVRSLSEKIEAQDQTIIYITTKLINYGERLTELETGNRVFVQRADKQFGAHEERIVYTATKLVEHGERLTALEAGKTAFEERVVMRVERIMTRQGGNSNNLLD